MSLLAIPAFLFLRLALWLFLPHAWIGNAFLYFFTLSRVDAFVVGGALALALRGAEADWLLRYRTVLLRSGYALFVGVLMFLLLQRHMTVIALLSTFTVSVPGFTLVDVGAAAVIFHAIEPGSSAYRVLQWKPLASLGAVSYGFYLLHDLPFVGYYVLCAKLFGLAAGRYVCPLFAFAITLGLAKLSYRYLETPFLNLKKHFNAQVHRAPIA